MTPGYSISLIAGFLVAGSLLHSALGLLVGLTDNYAILLENLGQFRLASLALAVGGGLLSFRSRGIRGAALAAAILAALPILAYSIPDLSGRNALNNGEGEGPGVTLRIAVANMGSPRLRRYDELLHWLRSADADVIAISEYDAETGAEFSSALSDHRYRLSVIRADRYGLAIYSRLSTADSAIETFDADSLPAISMQLTRPACELIAVHPLSPEVNGNTTSRSKTLRGVTATLPHRRRPFIFIGDMNTTERSRDFASLIDAGFTDSRQGRGWSPTWFPFMGRLWPLNLLAGIPLDHVLVHGNATITNRYVGPPFGSDHLPVLVELSIP